MTAVKVCGIKTRDVYEHLQSLPVDYIGFVFAPSKRQVTAEQVAELTQGVQKNAKLVGVFVNEKPEEMLRIARVAGLDVLQLHGDESPALCRNMRLASGLDVWRAWGVSGDDRDLRLLEFQDAVDAVLLDNERGGTGTRFSWDTIPDLKARLGDMPLFVAGGLHTDNVGDLLAAHTPYGVDVSSGVETDGAKDPEKITAFVTKARNS